ncbi:MAG: RNA-directed DNA polymerase [Hyphomicrobiaceae bacterium]|jgi:RNA-directed DNA polymerase
MDVLPKRLGRFGLTMHPDKSRLVRFRQPKPAWLSGHDDDDSKPPGTFDFLGFTHYWGETRKGGWAMKQKTAKDRLQGIPNAPHAPRLQTSPHQFLGIRCSP